MEMLVKRSLGLSTTVAVTKEGGAHGKASLKLVLMQVPNLGLRMATHAALAGGGWVDESAARACPTRDGGYGGGTGDGGLYIWGSDRAALLELMALDWFLPFKLQYAFKNSKAPKRREENAEWQLPGLKWAHVGDDVLRVGLAGVVEDEHDTVESRPPAVGSALDTVEPEAVRLGIWAAFEPKRRPSGLVWVKAKC